MPSSEFMLINIKIFRQRNKRKNYVAGIKSPGTQNIFLFIDRCQGAQVIVKRPQVIFRQVFQNDVWHKLNLETLSFRRDAGAQLPSREYHHKPPIDSFIDQGILSIRITDTELSP